MARVIIALTDGSSVVRTLTRGPASGPVAISGRLTSLRPITIAQ